jgi:hypothetical protein
MSYLSLLLHQKAKEWERASHQYHQAILSILNHYSPHDDPSRYVPDHITEYYHRAFDDYTLTQRMLQAQSSNQFHS